jgi:hypothetical protein
VPADVIAPASDNRRRILVSTYTDLPRFASLTKSSTTGQGASPDAASARSHISIADLVQREAVRLRGLDETQPIERSGVVRTKIAGGALGGCQ